jgi:hypothetical protein
LKKKFFFVGLVVLVTIVTTVVLSSVASVGFGNAFGSSTSSPTPITPYVPGGVLITPVPKQTPVNGVMAASPALKAPANANALSATTQVFTQQQVETWLSSIHNVGRVGLQAPSTVESMEFSTVLDLKKHHPDAENLNLPDEGAVCYVVLKGSFTISSPFASKGKTITKISLVFDAKNGNLLSVNEII